MLGVIIGIQKHIIKEELLVIQVGLESKRKISAIAKELKRSKSCISKEIHNNTDPTFGHYKTNSKATALNIVHKFRLNLDKNTEKR